MIIELLLILRNNFLEDQGAHCHSYIECKSKCMIMAIVVGELIWDEQLMIEIEPGSKVTTNFSGGNQAMVYIISS